MKTTKIFALLCVILLVCSCKQNDWLDWKIENELWLVRNAEKEGVVTTPTGLQYKCIEQGHGASARPDDAKLVTITYTGHLINGHEFDSADRYMGYVSSFVPGFKEGLKKMYEFGIYEFYIPYDLGYGEKGSGNEGTDNHIPPYSTLIFRVQLDAVN